MPLIPCPACGRDVSDAAPACPQCGQPIVGVVTPPPISVRAPVPELSVPATARADWHEPWWRRGLWALLIGGFALLVIVALLRAPYMPESPGARQDRMARARAAETILKATQPTGVEYVTWQGDTLQIVTARMSGDMQAMADAACVALRGQGVRGAVRVAVLERNAYLNARREYLGEARCDLPR